MDLSAIKATDKGFWRFTGTLTVACLVVTMSILFSSLMVDARFVGGTGTVSTRPF